MLIKCKMCGGDLRPAENATACECEFCGTMQTIPKLDSERRLNLYDRANHFRRNNEYDKAMGIFEQILQDDRTDAEAYWSLVLCRYGIEYVEDPATGKRIPTVNRAQFTSILADADYKSALEYADSVQKGIYETEARAIDDIQKGILDISRKEKPFDVFICYKETDAEGKRTPDSVLANDLYHQLTREGFKVFFSRITLEDKLGQQYEPYIFAALNSAKVMVVLGTRPEYFSAVWVKNEWSRYLALIKAGANKTLVPAYKDMDPYDLPEEFSHLQAQDMGKLGFMQDLIHGIRKLAGEDRAAQTPQSAAAQQADAPMKANVQSLLGRAFMALEDGEWEKADDFCEQALNQDFQNARAYLGKMMAELHVHRESDLPDQQQTFEENGNCQKALRFADEALKAQLTGANEAIRNRQEQQRLQGLFNEAMSALGTAGTVEEVQAVMSRLDALTGYQDAARGMKACEEKIEAINSAAYDRANDMMRQEEYTWAAAAFRALGDYRDSQAAAQKCDELDIQRKAELAAAKAEQDRQNAERRAREEAERREKERTAAELKRRQEEIRRREAEARAARVRKTAAILAVLAVICIAAFFAVTKIVLPKLSYDNAVKMLQAGQYDEAIAAFAGLGDYEDCGYRIRQAQANKAFADGQYDTVGDYYTDLPEVYQDHADDFVAMYNHAAALMEAGSYDEATSAFVLLGNYSDSKAQVSEATYRKACSLMACGNRNDAAVLFTGLQGYKDSKTLITQMGADMQFEKGSYADAWKIYAGLPEAYRTHAADYADMYAAAEAMLKGGSYDDAAAAFALLGGYSHADTMVEECSYRKAQSLAASGSYDEAIALFDGLIGYSDSRNLAMQTRADKLYDDGSYAKAYAVYAALGEAYQTHAADYAAMYAAAESARASGDYDSACSQFAALGNYGDATEKAAQCATDKANALFAAEKYSEAAEAYAAIGDVDKAAESTYKCAGQLAERGEYLQAAQQYGAIMTYRDSREQHYQMGLQAQADGKLADAYAIFSAEPEDRDTREDIYQVGVSASAGKLYEVSVPAFTQVGAYKDAAMKLTMDTYAWGGQLYDNADYDQAAEVFASMGEFSDAPARANEARYAAAGAAMASGHYDDAAARYTALGGYGDSAEKAKAAAYAAADEILEAGEYSKAKTRFLALGKYSDSVTKALECDYRPARALYDAGQYLNALNAITEAKLDGYLDCKQIKNDCRYQLGKAAMANGDYAAALGWFDAADSYSDSGAQAKECRYQMALMQKNAGQYDEAIAAFTAIGGYGDSKAQISACYNAKAAALEAAGCYEAAYEQYGNADNADKMRETAYQTAKVKLAESNYVGAVAWFEESGDYGDSKEQILSIGEYYYATQQYAEAEVVYTKVLGTGVAAQRLYELGQYYELAGDLVHAEKCFRKAEEYGDSSEKAGMIHNELIYQEAEALYQAEDWETARMEYLKIHGYKDADSKIAYCDKEIAALEAAALEAQFAVGNFVLFGTYPQTNSGTDKTPIEWLVLARDGKKALIISRYGLDAQAYNTDTVSMTWEQCTLRKWLNSTFVEQAFNDLEQAAILLSNVDNSKSQRFWSIYGGNDTKDKVFLLSYAEAKEYFDVSWDNSNIKSQTQPTAFAIRKGAYSSMSKTSANGKETGWWWLRSPGSSQSSAACVGIDGSLSSNRISNIAGSVRPVVWIDIEAFVDAQAGQGNVQNSLFAIIQNMEQ